MRSIALRLLTYLPALLVAMVLAVLGLSGSAQAQGAGPTNPFADPSSMLDAPLPGRGGNLPGPSAAEQQAGFDSLGVDLIAGTQAVLRSQGQNGTGGRTYQVRSGGQILLGGRKLTVEIVRDEVRLYDSDAKNKGRRTEAVWAGMVGSVQVVASNAGPTTQSNNQNMFAGSNLPSPSIKAVSSFVQYGAPGMMGVGGIGGAMGGMQGAATAPVQR